MVFSKIRTDKMMNLKSIGTGLLVATLAVVGCSDDSSTTSTDGTQQSNSEKDGVNHEEHSHGLGPNGGVVFDLGKYHAEFTVDHSKAECTILILGDDEKSTTPVAATELTLTIKETKTADGTVVAPMTIKMLPQDEADGKASTFVGTDPGIGNVAAFDGTVLGIIDGKPSQGEFSESDASVGHSHSHTGDDALVWEGEPKSHAGLEIKLGRHGQHLHAGEEVEPAVAITRDGQDVSDAKVFNALVSADGKTVLAEEVPTIYEPKTPEEPAHYAQGGLAIPKDVKQVAIRFRIAVPGADEVSYDVPVAVE